MELMMSSGSNFIIASFLLFVNRKAPEPGLKQIAEERSNMCAIGICENTFFPAKPPRIKDRGAANRNLPRLSSEILKKHGNKLQKNRKNIAESPPARVPSDIQLGFGRRRFC